MALLALLVIFLLVQMNVLSMVFVIKDNVNVMKDLEEKIVL
jgi:hypothetical protein